MAYNAFIFNNRYYTIFTFRSFCKCPRWLVRKSCFSQIWQTQVNCKLTQYCFIENIYQCCILWLVIASPPDHRESTESHDHNAHLPCTSVPARTLSQQKKAVKLIPLPPHKKLNSIQFNWSRANLFKKKIVSSRSVFCLFVLLLLYYTWNIPKLLIVFIKMSSDNPISQRVGVCKGQYFSRSHEVQGFPGSSEGQTAFYF